VWSFYDISIIKKQTCQGIFQLPYEICNVWIT
jgi:hypothetical protein